MKITYLGHSCFLITGKSPSGTEISVIIDPFNPKQVGLNLKSVTADVGVTSHRGHGDHDYFDTIKSDRDDGLFIIDTPGEYEVKDLRIFGYQSYHDDVKGKSRGKNTIYVLDFLESRVCHLGDLGHDLTSDYNELLEELTDIDILIIPVGGIYTIDPKVAMSVIEKIEPRIVIPMHYKTDKHADMFKELSPLADFLKEAGESPEPQKDFTIKSRSELPEDWKVVVLGG